MKGALEYFWDDHINGIGGIENEEWIYEERVSEEFAHRRGDISNGIGSGPLCSSTKSFEI
jgi:hypothetical protein